MKTALTKTTAPALMVMTREWDKLNNTAAAPNMMVTP